MSSQEHNKKSHKRKSLAGESSDLSVTVTDPSSSAGPVFVNFPAVKPSKNTPFTIYSRDPSSGVELGKQATILAGETEDVEYFSTNRNGQANPEGNDCQYLPALYDKSTGSLTIYQSSPLYLMSHRVKRLRAADQAPSARAADYRARRNDLGEAFGTKKAKSQIKAEERNKVDVNAMQSVKGHLMEAIGERMDEDEVAGPNELLPTPNLTTDEPSLVYPRNSLIPEAEWLSIDATSLLKAHDDRERMGLLPWRRSRIVEEKMRLAAESSASSTTKKVTLRMAYYLSALLAFNSLSSQLHRLKVSEIQSKLPGIPTQLLNGILSRFTESTGKRYALSEKNRTKLLTWICAVYLHLDQFNSEIGKVAQELNLPPTKIGDIFKSLGCKTEILGPAEREKMGLSMAEARTARRAILKAPVEYPKQKTRAPSRR